MIAIFGGDGFIGRHLTTRLLAGGEKVKVFSRRFDGVLDKNTTDYVQFIEGDFFHPMDRANALVGVEVVVQLISTSSPGLKNDFAIADIQENVIPHVEFIQECIRSGVEKIIFLSSGGTVYGPDAKVPSSEDSPTNPINSHGLTKLVVEKYLGMFGFVDGLNSITLRVSNPYGPGQQLKKGQGLVPAILRNISLGEPIKIFGDGSARRDYIFIDDLIEAILHAIKHNAKGGELYNIGSGESRSVQEVVLAIEESLGIQIEREYLAARPTDVDVAYLNTTKAQDVLKWQPKVSFKKGIEKTIADFMLARSR
ncbi:NAD-dependent epimerase/dehydratase family protein [Pararhizobium sp. PWRC1-1]|uniref:NAD-dependent epimerase/dehydratase family protein n=1 Tax=Pararhizobium sp. PWRC1-1 TaxID=2804566 RepID=UPI003CE6EE3C